MIYLILGLIIFFTNHSIRIVADGWRERLEPFETLVIPASVPEYRLAGAPGALACVGSIP